MRKFNIKDRPGVISKARISDDARRWLAVGEQVLLDQVPEFKGRMREMAGCSPEWDALVEPWDDLCATLATEVPDWMNPSPSGQARKTYDKMRAILRQAREDVDANAN